MGSQNILILEKTDSMFSKKGVIWMFLLFKKYIPWGYFQKFFSGRTASFFWFLTSKEKKK